MDLRGFRLPAALRGYVPDLRVPCVLYLGHLTVKTARLWRCGEVALEQ